MKRVVGERGQVTIPKRLRERFGIRAGQEVEFTDDSGRIVLTKAVSDDDPVAAVFGTLDLGMSTDDYIDLVRGPADLPPEPSSKQTL